MKQGIYVRPVGPFRFAYAFRLVEITPFGQWRCERWGMRDQQPVDDGHVHGGIFLNDMTEVLPGVWRDRLSRLDSLPWMGPVYFKRIDAPTPQRELFS
jgi:hypothetical protein